MAAKIDEESAQLAWERRDNDEIVGRNANQGTADSKYRGNWQWNYVGFPNYDFLPTPLPQQPRKRVPAEIEDEVRQLAAQDRLAARAEREEEAAKKAAEEPDEEATVVEEVEEVEEEEDDAAALAELAKVFSSTVQRNFRASMALPSPAKPLLEAPPEGVEIICTIRDRRGDFRGYITTEGEARNNRNQILGFVNLETWHCGSALDEYLGKITELGTAECHIEDALDEKCGSLDLGTGYLKDASDRIVGELKQSGVVTGHADSYLGEFGGLSFHHMKTIALYLLLLDPGMLSEIEG